jgi:hypothetical protein
MISRLNAFSVRTGRSPQGEMGWQDSGRQLRPPNVTPCRDTQYVGFAALTPARPE